MKQPKLTYLNLSSTNDEILTTIKEESGRAAYWHIKHYGGERNYDRWEDDQINKAMKMYPEGGELVSEMLDYHSLKSGNRWKTFEVTSVYNAGNAYTRSFGFCYYDTYGSVGAFCATKSKNGRIGVLVFTSHFFLRYADRMGIAHRDANLICDFFRGNHAFSLSATQEHDNEGRLKIMIGVPDGVCYGFMRTPLVEENDFYNKDHVFEVRTFIRNEQLTPKQKRESEAVRRCSDLSRMTDGAPDIHTINHLLSDKSFFKKFKQGILSVNGISEKEYTKIEAMLLSIITIDDFVTGDFTAQHKAVLNNNPIKRITNDQVRLFDIIHQSIKSDNNLNHNIHSRLYTITRNWRGADYDFRRWLWRLIDIYQSGTKVEDGDAWFQYVKLTLNKPETTDQYIEDIIREMDNIETD